MKIELANPWVSIAALMVGPFYVAAIFAKPRLLLWYRSQEKVRPIEFFIFCVKELRAYPIFLFVSFLVSLALVVGLHNCFVGVIVADNDFSLLYPWPRSDLHFKWNEITKCEISNKKVGIWGKKKYRLNIDAGNSTYNSLWDADNIMLIKVQYLIKTKTLKGISHELSALPPPN
jgi:hypothetical protein